MIACVAWASTSMSPTTAWTWPDSSAPPMHWPARSGLTTGNWTQFVVRVGSQLGTETRAWKNSGNFGHVGVIAGWGGRPEWLARAQELGCDTLLTGEALMFGILFARETGLNLVVAGHYATETPGVMSLSARLARELELDITFIPEDIIESRN